MLYDLPVTQKRFIRSEEGSEKFKYKDEEYNFELESTADILKKDNGNVYLSIQMDKEGIPIMVQTDSLDQNNRVVKKSIDFTKMKLINEYIISNYDSEGKISNMTSRKCPTCEVKMSFNVKDKNSNSTNALEFKSLLGDFEITKNKVENKTEYIQYFIVSEELKEAFKLAGKEISNDEFINSKIYKIEMPEYDSIIIYKKPYGEKSLVLSSIELLSKKGQTFEFIEYTPNPEYNKHYRAKYNQNNQILEIEDLKKKTIYKSEFNAKGQYTVQYSLNYSLRKTVNEYNEKDQLSKMYEFEELEGAPVYVILFQYK